MAYVGHHWNEHVCHEFYLLWIWKYFIGAKHWSIKAAFQMGHYIIFKLRYQQFKYYSVKILRYRETNTFFKTFINTLQAFTCSSMKTCMKTCEQQRLRVYIILVEAQWHSQGWTVVMWPERLKYSEVIWQWFWLNQSPFFVAVWLVLHSCGT